MTIEQTLEIPSDRRVFLEFVAPQEVPIGPARFQVKVIPVEGKPERNDDGHTPITDSLSGLLSSLGDISLDEIRGERLAKYLK